MAINFIPKIIYPTGGGTTITFTLPLADDPKNEEIRAFNNTAVSLSGVVQNSQDRQEETLTLKFRFVSQALTDSVATWFKTSASNKTEFDFHLHESEAITGTYYLVDNSFTPKRVAPDPAGSVGDFLNDFDLKIRRVL